MLSQGRSLRGLSEVADGTPISLANTTVHCIRQTYTVGWDILLQNVIVGRCMGSLWRCGHWREGVVTERGCGYPGEGVVTRERIGRGCDHQGEGMVVIHICTKPATCTV